MAPHTPRETGKQELRCLIRCIDRECRDAQMSKGWGHMKPMKRKKLIALMGLLAAVVLLAGCTTKPDNTNNSSAGAGYNGDLPWDILATVPPVDVTATAEIGITTPGPSDAVSSVMPWNTQDGTATSGIPGLVTLTPPPINQGVATMVPTSEPTATPRPTATPLILKLGSKGAEVRTLQTKLRSLGYMRTIDGDFGEGTEKALKSFQSRNGLRADGVAGPATMTKLNSKAAVRAPLTPAPTKAPPRATATPRVNANLYLKLNDSGAEVRRMQERLIELDYLAGKATGVFNTATEDAVIAFQKRNVSYFDGIAGPMTLSKLYSSTARRADRPAASVGVSLRRGDYDSDAVRALQRRLKDLGYYGGVNDGDFGETTELAVRAFQTVNGLTVDGVAGESTLNLLNSNRAKRATGGAAVPGARVTPVPTYTPIVNYQNVTPNPTGTYVILRPGDMGVLVSNLQTALKAQGYYTGTVDGKYGLGTYEAVMRFQADHGLSQDGKAGPATQQRLYEGIFPIGS
mgnify:CR=1 FL=1